MFPSNQLAPYILHPGKRTAGSSKSPVWTGKTSEPSFIFGVRHVNFQRISGEIQILFYTLPIQTPRAPSSVHSVSSTFGVLSRVFPYEHPRWKPSCQDLFVANRSTRWMRIPEWLGFSPAIFMAIWKWKGFHNPILRGRSNDHHSYPLVN